MTDDGSMMVVTETPAFPPVEPACVIADLLWLADECDRRCLFECSKWSREALFHMSDADYEAYGTSSYVTSQAAAPASMVKLSRCASRLDFARSLLIGREYRRARFFLERADMMDPVEAFLYYFSWYMVSTQRRVESDAADTERPEPFVDRELSALRHDFERFHVESAHVFDSFLHYLHGLILRDCEAREPARDAFQAAITCDHRCWPAWDALARLSDIFYSVKMERLPTVATTWQCTLYTAETLYRLHLFLGAIDRYTHLADVFGASPYIACQIAAVQSDLQEHDSAIASFEHVRQMDPYRVEQMNKFSDSLYIRQNVVELANLAKFFYANHKFAWETCCIVANYYSARGGAEGHNTAQTFLRRALRMNPTNTNVLVLLGHELMELTRNQSAVLAYRRAVVIDPLCYRAWYGLGQLYEILKLPAMALYYYQQAHKCRPSDSRMLIALGVILTRLNRMSDAEKCFKKAFQIGDMEGNALTHLARLYESQKDSANAAKAYEAYLGFYTEDLVGDLEQTAEASQFLAKYYFNADDLDTAYSYAQKCLNFNTSKEEGFCVLRAIMNRRSMEKSRPSASSKATRTVVAQRRGILVPAGSVRRRSSNVTADSSAINVVEDEEDEDSVEMSDGERSARLRLTSGETAPEYDQDSDVQAAAGGQQPDGDVSSQSQDDEDNLDYDDDDDDMQTSDDDDVEITY